MSTSNYLTRVAIVGAGGNIGRLMTEYLLKTGKHTVTAITRTNSQSKVPDGVITKQVDYSNSETLVDAFRGQDALVITLSGATPADTEQQLIDAAGEAGVSWILPNEWSPDTTHEGFVKDVPMVQPKVRTREAIKAVGKSSYIGISTGFWYEWMLAVPSAFGVDFAKQSVIFFDEGEAKISTSTMPQVGRAVAAVLSLPIRAEGSDNNACLDNFRDQVVYVSSFTISQNDMFESALRVTGTRREDWNISSVSSQERYDIGVKESKEGKRVGFAKMLATRVFFPDGVGDFESNKGTLNSLLQLPKENLDEWTRVAMERAKGPSWTEGGQSS